MVWALWHKNADLVAIDATMPRSPLMLISSVTPKHYATPRTSDSEALEFHMHALSHPLGVCDVGLAPWNVCEMVGMHHHDREPGFSSVKDRMDVTRPWIPSPRGR